MPFFPLGPDVMVGSARKTPVVRIPLRMLVAVVLSSASAWCAVEGPPAPDWPHLRGPNYTGVSSETGLVEKWPTGGPPVLWRVDLGEGYSSFVAVGDRLYTQTQSRSGQYVVCLDPDTGREIWRERYDWPYKPDEEYPGPRATPTVRDGRVYFAGAFGRVGCLDAADGRRLWSVDVTKTFGGEGTDFGYSSSPLVEDGKVYVPAGGKDAAVVALNATDGSVAWRSGDYAASYCSALPVTVGGRRQVVAFLRNVVAGFDAASGTELWQSRWSEGYDEHAAWPVFEAPYLLTCSPFRQGARCLRLDAGGTASVAWENKEMSNDVFSCIVFDGHVYGFDLEEQQAGNPSPAGRFKCMKLASGEVCWSTDRTEDAMVIGADGKLILFTGRGELILASATPAKYEELCRTRIFADDDCWAQPILHRGRLFVRGASLAACVYLGNPELLSAASRRQAGTSGLATRGERSPLASVWRGSSLTVPRPGDFLRWYLFSAGGVFGLAGVLFLSTYHGMMRVRPLMAERIGRAVFWTAVVAIGAAGTMGFSALAGSFVFTWPAALVGPYQASVAAALRTKAGDRRSRRVSLAAALALLGLLAGYYYLCRTLFIPVGFGFLTGFLPAFPVAVLVARKMRNRFNPLGEILWTLLTFSVYFWAASLFILWRSRM
jgi:hypothetical protein